MNERFVRDTSLNDKAIILEGQSLKSKMLMFKQAIITFFESNSRLIHL